ncbi:MAG: CoA transferase [Dehalococcoidia bacterium]
MNILEGIRVLDVSRFGAGPYCGWLLSRLGAEVIRVESPRGGGEFDRFFAIRSPQTGYNTMFMTWVSGKKSITLDLNQGEKAQELFRRLVANSDVVLESQGMEVAEAWGLTYEKLSKVKPDIILASNTAYGTTGPYRNRVGFDSTGQAISGAMSVTGTPDLPTKNSLAHIDFMTGTNQALGVVAALFHRFKTGKGQLVETSLLRTGINISSYLLAEPEATGRLREPRRVGSRTAWISFGDICKTKDGKWVYVGIVGPMLKRIFKTMGRDDLVNDPRFARDQDAYDHRDFLDPLIKGWIESKTADELEHLAETIRLSVTPVLDYTEVADNPQVRAEKLLVRSRMTDGSFSMNVPSFPVKFSEDMIRDEGEMPLLGEHNDQVWKEVGGLSPEEIARFKKEKLI